MISSSSSIRRRGRGHRRRRGQKSHRQQEGCRRRGERGRGVAASASHPSFFFLSCFFAPPVSFFLCCYSALEIGEVRNSRFFGARGVVSRKGSLSSSVRGSNERRRRIDGGCSSRKKKRSSAALPHLGSFVRASNSHGRKHLDVYDRK